MKKILLMLSLLVIVSSCQEGESVNMENGNEICFEKEKWTMKDGKDYLWRDQMLTNLLTSDTLKKLSRKEIYLQLGEPTRTDSLYLFYQIAQKRLGLWPLHTKTMVIKLENEGEVEWVKIHQ